MKYFITQGLLRPPLEVEIDGVPPCLFCGAPVVHESMDGPLVCGPCDCGCNADGSRWTREQAEERHAHRRDKIAEYRTIATTKLFVDARALSTREDIDAASARSLVARLVDLCNLRGEELAYYANECGLAKGERSALRDQLKWLRAEVATACDRLPPSPLVTALRAVVTTEGAVDIECPTCGAPAGWACEGDDYGYHAAGYHAARHVAARRSIFEETPR